MSNYQEQTKGFELIIKLNKQFKNDIELWRKIDGFERYSISNWGKVRNDKTGKAVKASIGEHGYYFVNLANNTNRKSFLVHRLVASAFLTNPDKKLCVDHINNQKKYNHINNLRFATYAENSQNKSLQSNNTSNTKGVSWHKRAKKWQAQIRFNNKNIHLGYFEDIEDAKEARIFKAKELFGEFINICEL